MKPRFTTVDVCAITTELREKCVEFGSFNLSSKPCLFPLKSSLKFVLTVHREKP